MNDLISATNAIQILGAVQGIVLGVILLKTSKRNKTANMLLATILFFFSCSICLHAVVHSFFIPFFTQHHTLLIMFGFVALGPLLYLYIRTLTAPSRQLLKIDVMHFIPLLICIFVVLPIAIGVDHTEKHHIIQIIVYTGVSFAIVTYLAVSIMLLRRFSKRIRDNFSSIEKIDLKWLRFLLFFIGLVLFASALTHVLFEGDVSGNYFWMATSLIIYLMGYFGLAQPEIFAGKVLNDFKELGDRKKYKKSTLTPERAEVYYKRLTEAMFEKNIYLNSDLTLSALAKEIAISTHHLSQLINEKVGQTFYDFVNSHRIEKAKEYLGAEEKQHFGIGSIGFEVGYNSLSAFNTAFKKFTGTTPSQFRKQKKA